MADDPWLLDQHSGWREYLRHDEATDTFAIQLQADVEPVVEWNKTRQNDGSNGYSQSREWRHVARIPPILVEIWKRQYGVDPLRRENSGLLKRLLNDPDLRAFRVGGGRV